MKNALVVGGNSGIGLSLVLNLIKLDYDKVIVIGKDDIDNTLIPCDLLNLLKEKVVFYRVNFVNEDLSILTMCEDVCALFITCGFGRVSNFISLTDCEIKNLITCNFSIIARILSYYSSKLFSNNDFYCAVMGSIAGHLVSPLMSVYGAAKAGLVNLIESINVELYKLGYKNRILDVSPGHINGTSFDGGKTDVLTLENLTNLIINKTFEREIKLIPNYETTYKKVLEKYKDNSWQFALESYDFKINSGRVSNNPNVIIGYLSGTFDLFHIGHLNLLRRAKQECDYLIVGVHESGSWKGKETFISFDERVDILQNIKYVDKVVKAETEDSDAWNNFKYHKLFVGSDYKGTDRFQKYEKFFSDKNCEIIYFSYTQGTSSTKLREILNKKIDEK